MASVVRILGIPGSLRKGSYNHAVLAAATDLTPHGVTLSVFDRIGEFPLFNQDQEQDMPEAVRSFKDEIRQADAILFATPEYNYSVPGVLKNAIDWVSRPYGDSAWEGKPVGIMSASGSMLGGARAQYHLRQIFVFLNMHPLNKPEVIIPAAQDKFDEAGRLTDPHTREKITEMLESLRRWTLELEAGEQAIEELEEADYQKSYRRLQN